MVQLLLKNIRSGKRRALITDTLQITKKELKAELNPIRKAMVNDFKRIVADWKSDVDFQGKSFIKRDFIAVNVFPIGSDKAIWRYVDEGTPPHTISAINAPTLKFQQNYNPRTLAKPARVVTSGNAGTSSGEWRSPITVTQSIKAREFTKALTIDFTPFFRSRTEAAYKRASRIINKQ